MKATQIVSKCLEQSKVYQEAKEITMLISLLEPDQRRIVEGIIVGMTLARQNA